MNITHFIQNNIGVVLSILFICLSIIFFYERVKTQIKNKQIIEVLDVLRFLIILVPLLFFLQTIIKVLSPNVKLSKNNQHILLSLILFIVGNTLSSVMFKIVMDKFVPSSLVKKNDFIFLIPIIHSIIYIIYIINQISNIFVEMKHPFGVLMSFIKNRLPMNQHNSATYISVYILLEIIFAITYVIVVYTNKSNTKVMNLICNDNKISKTCYKDISKDILIFSMFFKVILVCLFFSYILGMKLFTMLSKMFARS